MKRQVHVHVLRCTIFAMLLSTTECHLEDQNSRSGLVTRMQTGLDQTRGKLQRVYLRRNTRLWIHVHCHTTQSKHGYFVSTSVPVIDLFRSNICSWCTRTVQDRGPNLAFVHAYAPLLVMTALLLSAHTKCLDLYTKCFHLFHAAMKICVDICVYRWVGLLHTSSPLERACTAQRQLPAELGFVETPFASHYVVRG